MQVGSRLPRLAAVVSAGFVLWTTAASAQSQDRHGVTFGAGASPYDLAGTGTGFVIAGRVEHAVRAPVILEAGVTYFRYTSEGGLGDRVSYLMPEIGAQAGPRFGPVLPYLGVGLGFATALAGTDETDFTVHAAAGTRLRLNNGWGTRAEARVRAVDPWAGTTSDFTVGVTRWF